jgi:hypothetical protein
MYDNTLHLIMEGSRVFIKTFHKKLHDFKVLWLREM